MANMPTIKCCRIVSSGGGTKKSRKGRKAKGKGKGKKASSKSCTNARGKLKKGWRYGKGGRCVKAKAA